jgi:predicted O-linked N-acetylglucosamine transferase (SPINDLY family)
VHAYSIGAGEDSPLRRRIERAFEHFVDVSADSAERAMQRIRADGIDILIDLNGYTSGSRGEIFVAGAAPIQMHWLGFLGTQGAEWFDYIITDRFATPPAMQPFFTERFLYLDCYTPSDTGARSTCKRLAGRRRGSRKMPSSLPLQCYKIPLPVFDA